MFPFKDFGQKPPRFLKPRRFSYFKFMSQLVAGYNIIIIHFQFENILESKALALAGRPNEVSVAKAKALDSNIA